MQRHAHFRGKPMNFRPAHFPTDPTLADHTICAIVADGRDPLDYMGRVFSAVWADEKDVADEATLAALLTEAGFDAAAVIDRAKTPEIAAVRAKNTEDAVAVDASGVPCFVLHGEPFSSSATTVAPAQAASSRRLSASSSCATLRPRSRASGFSSTSASGQSRGRREA